MITKWEALYTECPPEDCSGIWEVSVKGEPGSCFEISVLRSDNQLGKISYGWFDSNKLHISSATSGGDSVTKKVWDKLLVAAEDTARELNLEEVWHGNKI